MVWTSFVSARLQHVIKNCFKWIGHNSHKHPFRFILCGILITILSGLGLLNYSYVSSAVDLWIPASSEIKEEYDKTIEYFGDFTTYGWLLLQDNKGENLLNPTMMDNLYDIFLIPMNNLTTESSNKLWQFNDLCERAYPSYPYCDSETDNFFALWTFTGYDWDSNSGIKTVLYTTDGQELASFLLGDLFYNTTTTNGTSTTYISGGATLRVTYALKATSNTTIYDANYAWMASYQDYWADHIFDYTTSDNIDISYVTTRSVEDEINRIVSADSAVYVSALLVMFIYLAFNLGNFTCIGARPWLAVTTILVMIMALITGYGLGSAFGYDFNSVILLIPYLLLGVGVDDEIIIVEAVDRTPYDNNDSDDIKGEKRFEKAMTHSGLSISLTSFCSVMAFAVGSFVDIPGVSAFCVFAALSFLANYVLQFLIFLPVLAMDEKRQLAKRNFCLCCIKHNTKTTPINNDNNNNNDNDNNNNNKENDNDQDNNKTETETETNNKAMEFYHKYFSVTSFIDHIILPLLSHRLIRLVIIMIFIIIFILSIVSLNSLDTTSDTARLVPDDSFVIDYLDAYSDVYGDTFLTKFAIVMENQDFSDNIIRNDTYNMFKEFEEYNDGDSYIIGTVDNWLQDFELYLNNTLNLDIDTLTQSEFYQHLKSFANESDYKSWDDEILYDDYDNPTKIKATKFYMNFVKPSVLREEWPLNVALNKIITNNLGQNAGYIFEDILVFAYFEYVVTTLTLTNILAASGGVLLVLMFFMDLRMAIFIILVVVLIDMDLFGWMVICGVSLDSLAFLQLVMAVGLTVDYVIHITHAIADARPDNEDDFEGRISIAMKDMGVGVLKGAWTTFLGSVALIFSQSEAFRTFFYMFSGIIIVACAHGMLFVPAVMGELSFLYKGIEQAAQNYTADNQTENLKTEINENNTVISQTSSKNANETEMTENNQ